MLFAAVVLRHKSDRSRATQPRAFMSRLRLRRLMPLFALPLIQPCRAVSFKQTHRLRGTHRGAENGGIDSKDLTELSSQLEMVFSYDGWRRDAKEAERMHREYPNLVPDILATMRRKQQVHSGDRSHRYIRRLDALTPTLSYNGWEDDVRKIEWPGRGGDGYCEHEVEQRFERIRTKQAEHDGNRDHANLRELDELVARLARNMQVPSASAPVPEAPTSAVLWDADTLPIQRLIEEVLAGKSCALSCLGLQPNLTHPKKTVRARFRVLAIRLHPDKESHPQATEAFVKVRAAHDRLMTSG